MNKQDKLNLDPGLKQIVEDYWKEKWQYFARQQDESDREYVRAFKDELIDLVSKAAQYQKKNRQKKKETISLIKVLYQQKEWQSALLARKVNPI